MQVSIETTDGLGRRMTVKVPEDRINDEMNKRLRELARTTRLKGFRPGKVPLKVVQQRFAGEVRREVIGDVIQSTFYEAVGQEKLRPAGSPQIEPKQTDAGSALEYVATFEVFPEIELASVESAEFEKPVVTVTDADVDKVLERIRKQNTEWQEVERAAESGDRVTIDFRGTIDGEDFQGNKGTGVPVTLGGNRMIPGFEDGLLGAKAGDELALELSFPDDYGYKEVAGKPVQFAVKVGKVEKAELPELDADFAGKFGIEEGGIEALRAEIRRNLEREGEQGVRTQLKQAVMDKLVELNPVTVPKALVDAEAQTLMEQTRQNLHTPPGKEGINLDLSMFEDQARRRVTLGLLLTEVVKRNNIKVEPDKLRERVEKLAESYDHPEEVIKWYYGDKRRLAEVESLVLEEQVVDWVLEHARVSEVERSFDEVMNPNQAA